MGDGLQVHLVGDLLAAHGVRQVLFVGEHQEHHIAQLVLAEHLVELFGCFADALAIVRVDYEHKSLCVLIVVTPKWSYPVATSNVPDCGWVV